ncbi:MAG: recombinase family protein [Lachnospiraceae bacterium]|nr:recombinase family protein [Lachnospiraceae bacterium]
MKEQTKFFAAMYLRLSRDDSIKAEQGDHGASKAESNSIGSQRELIRSFLNGQDDMKLYDSYVDDGFSGSNFDRPEFKRMMQDIEAGRVNCVVVKDLSRFGRDYIEAGRYLEKIFPALGVRFIALTDHYDSLSVDTGERQIVLPVKNFINDSYCRDISTKVKSQLAVKRKSGECLSAFAVYGYRKSPEDRNKLVVDAYAAEIVRRIFRWKIEGMAVSAIAKRLNELHILSPSEYKRSLGLNYRGGFAGGSGSQWGSSSVKRILTDEVYLGHLLQGKTEKINYKVKKSIEKPKEEWVRVENTHEAVISESDFETVQNLLKTDGRISPESRSVSPFMGLLFCGDCGEQMIRRTVKYKGSSRVYYICSTKNRAEGCSRHSIEENVLKELVGTAVRRYANDFLAQQKLFEQAREKETNMEAVAGCQRELAQLKQEQDKYYGLCAGLYEDLAQNVVTKEEFERLHREFQRKAEEVSRAQEQQQGLIKKMLQDGVASVGRLAKFQDSLKLDEIDRHTLTSMVKRIDVYEGRRIEIEFYFQDEYQVMQEYAASLFGQGSGRERGA